MIHKADCGSVKSIASNSKEEFTGSEVDVLSMYEECSLCEKCLENVEYRKARKQR
jgi:D-arabinose 1-dehydrogenase-like Zn-dependent alcohol dehydrogenase